MRHQHDPSDSFASVKKILSFLPLFAALNEEQLMRVAAATTEVRLERGEVLFHRGATPNGFYVVIFGQIKLSVTSAQGAQKVVEIISPKQSFGEAVMFLSRPYPVSAEALADSLLLHVGREHVDVLLASDTTFARRMLAGLSGRLHSLLRDVESYSLRSSMQRVIGYLLQHCTEGQGDTAEIALPTSKLVIASRLNLTPETLSRVLHDLSTHGLITVNGRTICVSSVKQLQEFDL